MKILGIIPARYASTRFPGKPLVDIKGKSMIRRVYEQSEKAGSLSEVVVATDDRRIFEHVTGFGGKAVMTGTHHQSGTDRCLEAMQKLPGIYDVVINIQGDEPFIDPIQIDELAGCFNDEQTDIATLVKKVHQVNELDNPSMVKVVINHRDQAMYFSRNIIPYIHEVPREEWLYHYDFYEHVGIYGYTAEALEKITKLPVSVYEKLEKLEQLRWLEYGFTVKVAYTEVESEPIDTPEDLERILRRLN